MLKAILILERFDKDWKLLERREQPSRSFVKNFISLLYIAHAQIQDAAPYAMTDFLGNARSIDTQCLAGTGYSKSNLRVVSCGGQGGEFCTFGLNAAAGYDNTCMVRGDLLGIQVGTGVGAVTPTDTALGTRIAHGRAATQMEYGGCELVGIAFANPNGEFTIRRYFTNLSAGGITVQEVGIQAAGTDYSARSAWAFLIARDLTGGVLVNNTELLRLTYTIQITV